MSARDALVIKIVKGDASPAELAALTSVLLSRAAALAALGPGLQDRSPVRKADWRRPERGAPHCDPRGWQTPGAWAA